MVSIATIIVPPLISYLVAINQSKNEINKLKSQQELEISRIKEEIDKQAELYERNKFTDVQYEIFMKMWEEGSTGLNNFLDVLDKIESLQEKTNKINTRKFLNNKLK